MREAKQFGTAQHLTPEVLAACSRLHDAADRVPMLWFDLLVPTLRAHAEGVLLLRGFERARRWNH